MALVVRSRGRSRDRPLVRPRNRTPSPSPIVIRRKSFGKPREIINRPRRTDTGDTIDRERIRGTEIIRGSDRYEREPIRDVIVRERERNASPMSVTKHRPGPRYQGGGVVLNESQRKEKSKKDASDIYYIPKEKKGENIPAVQITQDEDVESKPPPARLQPAGSAFLKRRSSLDTFDRFTERKEDAGKSSPHNVGDPTTGSEPLKPSAKRSWSRSSTRVLPVVKPSVPPILMWPVGRANTANPSPKPNDSSVNGMTELQSANDSSIVDLLDRVHDHLLGDQCYEHNRLFLATDQATRQDPLFKFTRVLRAKNQ